MGVINTLELEGVSTESWGDAAREALREASRTIRNIKKMDIIRTHGSVRDGNIQEFRTEVRIFFEVEQRP